MVKEIADHFQRSPVTIGEVIMKVEDLLKRDKSFEKVLNPWKKIWSRGGKENTGFALPDPEISNKVVMQKGFQFCRLLKLLHQEVSQTEKRLKAEGQAIVIKYSFLACLLRS
jgi:hypothetical protein